MVLIVVLSFLFEVLFTSTTIDFIELHMQNKDLTIHDFSQCSGAFKMLVWNSSINYKGKLPKEDPTNVYLFLNK